MANTADVVSQDMAQVRPFSMIDTSVPISNIAEQCGLDGPSDIEDIYPCTPLQEGLISLSMEDPGKYLAVCDFELPGSIDQNRLERAWETVVENCPILRTRLVQTSSNGCLQVVTRTCMEWNFPSDIEHHIMAIRKIGPASGASLTSYAIVRDGQNGRFVWTVHHALYDGVSLLKILSLVEDVYHGRPLPHLSTGFNAAVAYLRSSDRTAAETYWSSYLQDAKVSSFPKPLSKGLSADRLITREISVGQTHHDGITMATLIRAAWSILLARYNDATDVIFGNLSSGRNLPVPGIEDIIGPTITSVPIRTRPDPEKTLDAFLYSVQDDSTQMIPFEHVGIQNISRLGADAKQACDFQSFLVIQPPQQRKTNAIFGSPRSFGGTADFNSYPLMIECTLSDSASGTRGFKVDANFSSASLNEKQMSLLLRHFDQLVQEICRASPNATLRSLNMTTEDDLEVIACWNQAKSRSSRICLHELFEATKRRRASAPAIHAWDGTMSYDELSQASTLLSWRLVDFGVGPEQMVPICFEKSLWAIVSMLAVLKAGGACVPIDKDCPPDRLQKILDDTSASVVVCSPSRSQKFRSLVQHVLAVDKEVLAQFAREESKIVNGTHEQLPVASPTDLAYVMFTSGSTGVPKGILLEHGALSTSLLSIGQVENTSEDSRVLQFSAFTFDVSLTDIYTTFIYGGCLCIPSEEQRMDDLAGFMESTSVNHAGLTASVAAILDPASVPSLRSITLGGEPLTSGVLARWIPQVRILNAYGVTECCVDSSVNPDVTVDMALNNIGKGINGPLFITELHSHERLAPIGVPGELLISGFTIARGYLNDNSRTNASFITRPSWAESLDLPPENRSALDRLYKTGDIVKYHPDGTMQFIARKDTQVKLRGLRIELGEIEHQLARILENIYNVAVEVVTPSEGVQTQRLVAFIAIASIEDESSEAGVLRSPEVQESIKQSLDGVTSKLAQALPPYMIPDVFVPMSKIPQSVSGKTDRRRLRSIAASFAGEDWTAFSKFSDRTTSIKIKVEKHLHSLWSKTLHLSADLIGRDSNFFQLGGDSVQAMRLVSLAREVGIQLRVDSVFKYPTIGELGVHSHEGYKYETGPAAPFSLLPDPSQAENMKRTLHSRFGISPEHVEDILPATPLQEGMTALSVRTPGLFIAQDVWELPSGTDRARLRFAWERTCQVHSILRTRIVQLDNGECMQVVVKESPRWNYSNSLHQCMQEVSAIHFVPGASMTGYYMIDDETSKKSFFIWIVHHALYDGWSLPRLFKTLSDCYHGRPVASPKTHFSSLVRYLKACDRGTSANFWRKYHAGTEGITFPEQMATGQKCRADRSWTHKASLPNQKGPITVPNIICAAWGLLMGKYSDTTDVVYGLTLAGRSVPVPGIDEVVGPTITTVPIRINVDASSVALLLTQVQTAATEMMPHQHFGLQGIRRLNSDTKAACDFQNLLLIQPAVTENEDQDVLGKALTLTQNVGDFSSYPLMVECKLGNDGFDISVSYSSSRFDQMQIQRMMFQFETIASQLMGSSESSTPVADISLISAPDKDDICLFNLAVPESVSRCIHEVISTWTQERPCSEAVCAWDGKLSYEELEHLTENFAQALIHNHGVLVGNVVPVCAQKSVWVVVAMLGILKAGASFVALDYNIPAERLHDIIDQTAAPVVVVDDATYSSCHKTCKTIFKISNGAMRDLPANTSSLPSVSPNDLAITLFTSGSTGRPKGILHSHESFCTAAFAFRDAFRLGPETRTLQFASYSFDVSVIDTFSTLLHGGCVCIPSETQRLGSLPEAAKTLRANSASLTPSVARLYSPSDFPTLKTLIFAGEAARRSDVEQWRSHVCLVNAYGPAETSFCSCATYENDTIPPLRIGLAVGCNVWVTDPLDYQKLAPFGTIGELVVEGPIVARGYLENEAATRATFVEKPNFIPHNRTKASRFYRTGDLVRYNSDFTLDYVGRRDDQRKIRGQRIELGEIEHHLRQSVADCVDVAAEVIPAKSQGSATSVLAAFLQPGPSLAVKTGESSQATVLREPDSRVEELISSLSKFLPGYMIPTIYFRISTMPYTPSKKLNRRELRHLGSDALANPSHTPSVMLNAMEEMTAMERRLAKLFAFLLGVDQHLLGPKSHFFRLGGDSIDVMKLMHECSHERINLVTADIYQSPILHDLAAVAEKASSHQLEVIEPFSLLPDPTTTQEIIVDAAIQCGVTKEAIEDIYPCTALQEGLMAISVKKPGTYLAHEIVEMPDNVDSIRLVNAWEAAARAFPILRTRIINTAEHGAFQVVIKESLSWFRETGTAALKSFFGRPVKNYGGRLARFAILDMDDGRKLLCWTLHHAVYDGWSLKLVLQHVEQAYWSGTITKPVVEFKHMIRYLNSTNKIAAATFWRSQLQGIEAPAFPITAPEIKDYESDGQMDCSILLSRTGSFGEVTRSAVIRTAWALLIRRYTNSNSEALFGTTLSGRNAPVPCITDIAGPTFTTVPIRIQMEEDMEINRLLSSIQSQMVDMIPFEHVGLQNIRQLGDDARAACEFRNLLIIQPPSVKDHPAGIFVNRGTSGKYKEPRADSNSYALLLECTLEEDSINVTAQFDNRIVDNAQMGRMLKQFDHILQQITHRSPSTRVCDIEVLSRSDADQLYAWGSIISPMFESCIHDLILEQCKARPNSPAINSWDGDFTYRELEDKAFYVRQYLADLGVDIESRVAICLEKSKWVPVFQLAILKAGATVVMLDPSHPTDHLMSLIRKAEAELVFVDKTHGDRFPAGSNYVVEIPDMMDELTSGIPSPPSHDCRPHNAAFIVFTSGDTSPPQGVVIEHRNLAASLRASVITESLSEMSRVLQFTSCTSVVGITDAFTTLCTGGCLCIPSEGDRKNDIIGAITRSGANYVCLTPTYARLFRPDEVPCLKTLCLSGGPLPRDAVAKWIGSKCRVMAVYGSAETCGAVACRTLPSILPADLYIGDIGRGLDDRVLWLTEPTNPNRLAPIGAIGEIVVESPSVARGYLNDNGGTSKAFITAPDWLQRAGLARGSHLYRTGDLARYSSEGSITILGKGDTRAKLRGQVLDLREIEYQVRKLICFDADVAVQVVTCRNQGNKKELAAFLSERRKTSKQNGSEFQVALNQTASRLDLDFANLEAHLSASLPQWMVPSLFIPLNSMPFLTAGHVNRQALDELAESLSLEKLKDYSRQYTKSRRRPKSNDEILLHGLWAQTLGLDGTDIGLEDSFFRLGGDSVAAMRLVAAVRRASMSLTVTNIFRFPHLEAMTRAMTPSKSETKDNDSRPFSLLGNSVPLQTMRSEASRICGVDEKDIEDIYPCSPLQRTFVEAQMRQADLFRVHFVLSLPQDIDIERLFSSWRYMVDRQPILRTRIADVFGNLLQVVLKETHPAWRLQLGLDLHRFLEEDRSSAMKLGQRLHSAAVITNAAEGISYFVWSTHHALYDGWSSDLMFSELLGHYYDTAKHDNPIPYRRYIKYLLESASDRILGTWTTMFADKLTRPLVVVPPGYHCSASASQKRSVVLPAPSPQSTNVTLSTIVTAAWGLVFAGSVQCSTVVFELMLAGRNAPVADIERIIGPLATQVPLIVDVNCGDRTVLAYLQLVQERLAELIPIEHVGWDNIKNVSREAREACKSAIPLNIHPRPSLDHLEAGKGFKLLDIIPFYLALVPFYLDCQFTQEGFDMTATFDSNLLGTDRVGSLLAAFERIFYNLLHARDGLLLDDLKDFSAGWT